MRIIFIVALIVGVLVNRALNKLQRNRLERMMLGVVLILTGSGISSDPGMRATTFASVVGVGLLFLGFVLGIMGFFKRKSKTDRA